MKKLMCLFAAVAALGLASTAAAKSPQGHYDATVSILTMGSDTVTFQVTRTSTKSTATSPMYVGEICTNAAGQVVGDPFTFAYVTWDSSGIVGTAGPLPDYADLGATQCQAEAAVGGNVASQPFYFTPS